MVWILYRGYFGTVNTGIPAHIVASSVATTRATCPQLGLRYGRSLPNMATRRFDFQPPSDFVPHIVLAFVEETRLDAAHPTILNHHRQQISFYPNESELPPMLDPLSHASISDATRTTSKVKLWKVWKTADKLEARQASFYPRVTPKVVSILREWGSSWDGQPGWKSLLDKQSLYHECEESIIAIYHLMEGVSITDSSSSPKYIAVDVCGGKGLFSFLLSYFRPPNLDHIILLEKADINWHHIDEANRTALSERRAFIQIWRNTNLHDYDEVLDRLSELQHPVAMTGIHLCKQLSPSFCGLVNGLGKKKCIYACLAPCCMPRAITSQKAHPNKSYSLFIQLEENAESRQLRREFMERRERLKRKPKVGPCFHCQELDHNLVDCPVLPNLPKDEQTKIRQDWHAASIPCWNCLEYGHFKSNCPRANDNSLRNSKQPPMICINVSKVLQTPQPYQTYCHLLTDGLRNRRCQVIETELENQEKHQEGNWNSGRKSIFIVSR
eukprot:scaffold6428_cov103-Cylindrotheca_fusiformis.AAC.1